VYEVLLERRVERDLKKLPVEVFHRIIPHLKSLADDPKQKGARKIIGSKRQFS
jgi:mRNA interferase RelE/StbE